MSISGINPDASSTGEVSEATLDADISACASDNPCEASWQRAYAYAADRAYDMAIYQALQGIIFAGLQYASADRTADLQYDIANRQMLIAEEEYQRYKDNYVECEDALAAEICAMECPDVDYDTRADRAVRDVRKQFSIARMKLDRVRNKYCLHDHMVIMCDMEKEEALAVVKARDISYRYAEKRHDYLDERRWKRRLDILQHGRNIFSGQSNTYNSGSGMATQALDARQDAIDNLLGALSGGLGSIINAYYAKDYANASINGFPNSSSTMINSNSGFNGPRPVARPTGLVSGISPGGL